MSERLVIVIEYAAGPDPDQGLRDAMTQIREGVDRLDRANVRVVGVHAAIKDDAARVLAVFEPVE